MAGYPPGLGVQDSGHGKKQRKMKKEIAKPEMFANVFSGNRLASIEKNLA